jgi:hypothetical protein
MRDAAEHRMVRRSAAERNCFGKLTLFDGAS